MHCFFGTYFNTTMCQFGNHTCLPRAFFSWKRLFSNNAMCIISWPGKQVPSSVRLPCFLVCQSLFMIVEYTALILLFRIKSWFERHQIIIRCMQKQIFRKRFTMFFLTQSVSLISYLFHFIEQWLAEILGQQQQ